VTTRHDKLDPTPRYDEVYEEFVRDFGRAELGESEDLVFPTLADLLAWRERKTSADKQKSRHIERHTENGQIPVDEQRRLNIGPFNPVTGAFKDSALEVDRALHAAERRYHDAEIDKRMRAPEPFSQCSPIDYGDPFKDVWADDFVHQCTFCGYLMTEIQRRVIRCPISCPRCNGDRWTEYKGLTCTENEQKEWRARVLKRQTFELFTQAAQISPRTSPMHYWNLLRLAKNKRRTNRLQAIKAGIKDRMQTVAGGLRAMESWVKLAFTWLFLGVVLTSGLLVFGIILVSLSTWWGVTTLHAKLKNKIKSLSIY
jgi:hypothetical protein